MKIVCFLLCALVYVDGASKLPPFVQQCYRDDMHLSDCLIKNMESLKTRYPDGPIPELQIPSLYPLKIPSASFEESGLVIGIKDLGVWSLDNMIINSVQFDSKHFNFEFYYPAMGLESLYTMKGKLLILDFDGEGNFKGNMTNVLIKYTSDLDAVNKHGKEYLNLKTSQISLTMESYNCSFTNLFKNNEELTARANQLLNENQQIMLEQFTPLMQKISKGVFDSIVGGVFRKYPADVLWPLKNGGT